MPHKRTYRHRRTVRWKKRGNTAYKAAQALKMAYELKQLVNAEAKIFDTTTALTVTDAGAIVELANIPQGDTNVTRSGRSVKLKSIRLNWRLTAHASSTNTAFRVIIFRGKAENNRVFAVTQFLEAATVQSQINQNIKFQKKVLLDKFINIANDYNPQHLYNKTLPLNFHMNWDATDTDGTNVEDGGLYMLVLATEATNDPTFNIDFRLRFYDN